MANHLSAQYRRNVSGFERMLAVAEQRGRPVNGYTAEQLRGLIAQYQRLTNADPVELAAHLDDARERMAARLRELRGW